MYVILEDKDSTKKLGYHWLLQGTLAAPLSVLDEMHLIEFYLVGRSVDWVVAENHHDMWIAAAAPAVKVLKAIEAA